MFMARESASTPKELGNRTVARYGEIPRSNQGRGTVSVTEARLSSHSWQSAR
jgi:hypothetical protein